MSTVSRRKKKLRDNLSLSSKLLLKELFSVALRGVTEAASIPADFAGRVANRLGIKTGYSLEPPVLNARDLVFPDSIVRLKQSIQRHELVSSSIVIPVFEKAAFTFQCLMSLLEEVDLRHTEIIVVNNASRDETSRLLAQLSELVRVINNVENQGFVEACNQGAAIANGKYLVFLNNDTMVAPGWLKCLLRTVERDSSVGAVGSMFLYPDGWIQEAGAVVWRNGEAYHYGWGRWPEDLRFTFAREVDYCSAASLLIRKELFDRIGGFDDRFAPAYYEDIDLCFAVRAAGYRVIYQPLSRVVHYEGVTAGRDTSKGIKQYQIINREKFVDKWRDTLEKQHLDKDLARTEEAANRRRNAPRVIVFDERIPTPDRDAGSARMFMILKALLEWSHVVFVPFNRPSDLSYEKALWELGIETARAVDFRRLLKNTRVQAAVASRPSVAQAMIPRIHRINKHITIVFDMVDAHFIRLQREYDVSGDNRAAKEAKLFKRVETRLAHQSDLVWCNSSEDKSVMANQVPETRIEVIPTIHELHRTGEPFESRHGLLFVGNLAHRPNEDAVHFFMQQIFPLLQSTLPKVTISIVGDNVSPKIACYESEQVRITGYLPDIGPLFHASRVFVAPLRFGAGVKGKIGEAMSYGLPVVTTTVGAEGFGLENRSNAMIVDDPEMFAQAITQLYSEKQLWESLSQNSRRQIEQYFTPQVIAQTINNSVREVCAAKIHEDSSNR